MALSAAIAWEVRTTGLDTNGGGFKAGATGSDFSQQDTPQYSVTDGVTNGTTTITSATANFGTDVVGNVMYVQGGTGSITAGWYEITARTNSTTITVDRSTGLTAGTGVTLHIGGALLTINTVAGLAVQSNKIFVKAGSGYSTTATITFTAAGAASPSSSTPPTRIIGYTTTRTDGGRATITASTNSGITVFKFSNWAWYVDNFVVDCNSLATSIGIEHDGGYSITRNCLVKNFTSRGIYSALGSCGIMGCELTGGTSAATAAISASTNNNKIIFNYVHDCSCTGILGGATGIIAINNLIVNLSGAGSNGIEVQYDSVVMYNTVSNVGNVGFFCNSNFFGNVTWRNNTFSRAGGYGMYGNASAGIAADPQFDGNGFWSNTSGTRNFLDDTTGINGVAAYTNVHDVAISGSSPTNNPFNNSGSGDFGLNSTAGAGALWRAAGYPGLIVGSSTTNYEDFGAAQHQDSGGSAGMLYVPNLEGL